MPTYSYTAKDMTGKTINGSLEADSRAMVTSRLQSMGYFPLEIQGKGGASSGKKSEDSASGVAGLGLFKKRVKARDLMEFFRQMSDLVSAGVPLVKSLGIVRNQGGDPYLASLLAQIDRDVQSGDTFARALEKHPGIFDKLAVAMIHAGESGGMLDEVLTRLADFAEAEEEVRSKIKSALAYPVIMSIAGTGAIIVLLTFVIPKIVGVFEEMNQALPLITQILLTTTDFLSSFWWLLIIAGAVAITGFIRYKATDSGGLTIDRFMLRVPIFGDVILKREVARFTRTFGSLLRNGVPILQALDISSEVLSNKAVILDIIDIPAGIAEGKGISGTLRSSHFFPPVVTNMIQIGEETGNLPDVLLKVAATYETQVDRAVKTMTSVIEPIIILAMGLIVGFIVIAMLLPIFQLDPTGG